MSIPQVSVGGVVANIVLAVFSFIAVSLRFYARKRSKQPLKSDDWIIFVSLIFCIGLAIESTYAASSGIFGVSLGLMTAGDVERFFKVQFADGLICHFVYGLIKISVVLFYKRIFKGKSFSICANVVLALISLFMAVSFFTILFSSKGVSTYWTTPLELSGTTDNLNLPNLIIALASIDIFLDIAVLSLPFPVINRLQMSRERKIYVSGVFLLGAFCLISSAIRLWVTQRLFGSEMPDLELDEEVYLWSHVEAYASIITACLPTLSPLFLNMRSLDSIVGSVRSALSIRSKGSSLFKPTPSDTHSQRSRSSDPEKAAWTKNHSEGMQSTIERGTNNHDLEAQISNREAIMVQKTFVSDSARELR